MSKVEQRLAQVERRSRYDRLVAERDRLFALWIDEELGSAQDLELSKQIRRIDLQLHRLRHEMGGRPWLKVVRT